MEENVKELNIKTQFWSFLKASRTKSIKSTHFYNLDDPTYFLMSIKKISIFNFYVYIGHFLQLRISITLQNWTY